MRILVCGAAGFLGAAIAERLAAAGHTVLRGVRHALQPGDVAMDFAKDTRVEVWLPRLQEVDAVINAVGILTENRRETFSQVHCDAPCALFAACARQGVRRIVQVSALGAESGQTPYFTSKRAADAFLMGLALDWQIIQPALVYGTTGTSARFFRSLASLPILVLPGDGRQRLQPVHVDDVAEAVCRLLESAAPVHQVVPLVGPQPVTCRDVLRSYRAALGLPPARELRIPATCIGMAARLAGWLPGALLTPDTWTMLQAGNTGDPRAITDLLGRAPRGISDFVPREMASALRHEALAGWWLPLLRVALALVWIGTAVVSAGVYPVEDSVALLARVGLHGIPALLALYGATLLDLGFGIATLFRPGRTLWLLQLLTVMAYSIIIAVILPEFLIHPFGPITKNVPILALLVVLYSAEGSR